MNKSTSTARPLCLVTGANTGIGFEIARGLARTRARVVLACRNHAKGEAARSIIASEFKNTNTELLVVDLASQQSIRAATREFSEKYDSLDVLVNNAATSSPTRQVSPEGIELTFATNVLGYHLLTALLLESLKRAPWRDASPEQMSPPTPCRRARWIRRCFTPWLQALRDAQLRRVPTPQFGWQPVRNSPE
jgi:NAD(P)-dependent dehydrogenase (short-subunit alcohol dehydrogenase family)